MNFKQALTFICLSFCIYITPSQATFDSNECLSSNAFYNDTILRCQCDQGYAGLGDLCCDSKDKYDNCNVGGDPWLTTYDGSQVPIYFPCLSRFSVVNSKTRAGRECVVETMNTGHFVNNGAMYGDRFVVSFNIGGTGRQLFRIVGGTVKRPGDTQYFSTVELFQKRLFFMRLSGEVFIIRYTSARNIWTITGCNMLITFRPSTTQKALQDSRPGICVRSLKDQTKASPLGKPDQGDVCSVSRNGLAKGSVLQYDVLYNMIKDYKNIGAEARAVHPDYLEVCNAMEKVVSDKCTDDVTLRKSVNKCATVLYGSALRLCLQLTGSGQQQVVELFNKCLGFQCSRDVQTCKAYLASSKPLSTCFPKFCEL